MNILYKEELKLETFLSFSSLSSLLTYLNVIFIGIVVFVALNRFDYIINVTTYAIAKTFIPIITSLIFGKLLGINATINVGTVLILLILYFILGLLVVKITEKIIDYFNSDTIIYFISVFGIIDSIVSWLFSCIIGLLL